MQLSINFSSIVIIKRNSKEKFCLRESYYDENLDMIISNCIEIFETEKAAKSYALKNKINLIDLSKKQSIITTHYV